MRFELVYETANNGGQRIFTFDETLKTPFPTVDDCPKLPSTTTLSRTKLQKPYFNVSNGRNHIEYDQALWKYIIINSVVFNLPPPLPPPQPTSRMSKRIQDDIDGLEKESHFGNGINGNILNNATEIKCGSVRSSIVRNSDHEFQIEAPRITVALIDGRTVGWNMPSRCVGELRKVVRALDYYDADTDLDDNNDDAGGSSLKKLSDVSLHNSRKIPVALKIKEAMNEVGLERARSCLIDMVSKFVLKQLESVIPKSYPTWSAESSFLQLQQNANTITNKLASLSQHLDTLSNDLQKLHVEFLDSLMHTRIHFDPLCTHRTRIFIAARTHALYPSPLPSNTTTTTSRMSLATMHITDFSDAFIPVIHAGIISEITILKRKGDTAALELAKISEKLTVEVKRRDTARSRRLGIVAVGGFVSTTFRQFSKLLLVPSSDDESWDNGINDGDFNDDDNDDDGGFERASVVGMEIHVARLERAKAYEGVYRSLLESVSNSMNKWRTLKAEEATIDSELQKAVTKLKILEDSTTLISGLPPFLSNADPKQGFSNQSTTTYRSPRAVRPPQPSTPPPPQISPINQFVQNLSEPVAIETTKLAAIERNIEVVNLVMDTTEAGTAMHILARAAEHHSAIPSSLFRHRPLRIWTDNGYRARKPFKRRKEFKVEVGESRRGTATTHGVEVYRMTKRRVSPIKMDPRKRVVVGVDCDGKKLEDVVSKDWLGTHNPPINWHSLELPLTKLADVSENVRVGESNDDGDGDVLDRGQAARLIGLLDRWCRDEIEKKRKD